MAIAPTCSECRASMVAAEAVADGKPIGFRRNGWAWDAAVLLCTKCGSVRLRGANMRQDEGRAPQPRVRPRSGGKAARLAAKP
jgi:hypothetical protein